MLVLSRRQSEEVLFPGLGITIKVTHVKGRTVCLGIDAPDEIRIIRAELDDYDDHEVKQNHPRPIDQLKRPRNLPGQTRKCLEEANLAIRLAQNQLGQHLTESAGRALEDALDCLDNLENAIGHRDEPFVSSSIGESKPRYHCSSKMAEIDVGKTRQFETLSNQRPVRLDWFGRADSTAPSNTENSAQTGMCSDIPCASSSPML